MEYSFVDTDSVAAILDMAIREQEQQITNVQASIGQLILSQTERMIADIQQTVIQTVQADNRNKVRQAITGLSDSDLASILKEDNRLSVSMLATIAQPGGSRSKKVRGGGPPAHPIDEQLKIVKGWLKVKGKVPKDVYAGRHGIDQSTLWRWEKFLRKKGLI